MGEGKKEGKYFAFTIYFGLFLIVALDVVAGFVAMEAEVAQQEVHIYVSYIYMISKQIMIMMAMIVSFMLCP